MGKVDVLSKFAQDQGDAVGKVYDGGFADGVASVPASGISVDQEAADIALAVADLKAQIVDLSAKVAADDAGLAALQAKLDQIKALLA